MHIKRFTAGPVMTNSYVVSENGEALIIDAPIRDERLIDYVKREKLTVKGIVLTHGHFDHIMGAEDYRREFKAQIYAGIKERPIVENGEKNGSSMFLGRPMSGVKPDVYLKEGDSISVGDTAFKVYETPGHTPGGICLYTEGTLFSGDTLFHLSVGRTDFEEGSYPELVNSIRGKLYALPDNTDVYPGHEEMTRIGFEKENNSVVRF